MSSITQEEQILILKHNYRLVRYNYRMGRSQHLIAARAVEKFKDEETNKNQKEKQNTFFSPRISDSKTISFKDAVFLLKDNLEKTEGNLHLSKLLKLEIEIHIFESLDSLLACPPKLYKNFIEYTTSLYELLKSNQPEVCKNKILQYVSKEFGVNLEKEKSHAVKMLLLASLCGVTGHYRQHTDKEYKVALIQLKSIHRFIEKDLPNLFGKARSSFGLLGLSLFLLGQLERTQSNLEKSEEYFLAGVEAYTERIIQYENLFLDKKNKEKSDKSEYEEKRTVSLRRSMLIVSLGLCYNYLITGKLSKGLFSVRLARATLRKVNSGIYNEYTDLLYFALLRAKYSNNETHIDEIIKGLGKCKNAFEKIARKGNFDKEVDPSKQMHYKQRANIELALAYRYKTEFIEDYSLKMNEFKKAIDCLNEAITFGKEPALENSEKQFGNIHTYIEAMYISSHIHRIKAENESNKENAREDIDKSVYYAEESEKIAKKAELKQLLPEALLAKAAVYIYKAKASDPNGVRSSEHFKNALKALKDVLDENEGRNKRVQAVARLRLSELFSVNPKYNAEASFHFSFWEENLAAEVEHSFCHLFAEKHREKISNFFLIVDPDDLRLSEWEKELRNYLAEQSVRKLAKEHIKKRQIKSTERSIRGSITKQIQQDLEFTNELKKLVDDNDLIAKYQLLTKLEISESKII